MFALAVELTSKRIGAQRQDAQVHASQRGAVPYGAVDDDAFPSEVYAQAGHFVTQDRDAQGTLTINDHHLPMAILLKARSQQAAIFTGIDRDDLSEEGFFL